MMNQNRRANAFGDSSLPVIRLVSSCHVSSRRVDGGLALRP